MLKTIHSLKRNHLLMLTLVFTLIFSQFSFVRFASTVFAAAYEAEAGTLAGGAVVAADHTGYTGTGFVGGFTDANKGNASLQFTINAATAGTYNATLRYANATGLTQTLSIYVNGTKIKQTSLTNLANWDTWGTKLEALTLAAGNNTIKYMYDTTDSGNVNLDNLNVVSAAGTPTPTPPPSSGGSYEAEASALSGGTAVFTDHTGYSGTGFVGGFTDANKGNAASQFTVNAAAAGNYNVTLRYANATTLTQTLSIYVNGTKIRQTSFVNLANWDTWGSKAEVLSLTAGSNTILIKYDTTDSGNVNLDKIDVVSAGGTPIPTTTPTPVPTATPTPPPPSGGTYQAESAALAGGTAVATDHAGYTGTGFVGGFSDANKGNAAITFTVNVTSAGVYPVTLRYANASGPTQTLSIYVNGGKLTQASFPNLANWDTWGTQSTSITLNNGNNTIMYKYDTTDTGNVNLDKIDIGPKATPTPTPVPTPVPTPTPTPGPTFVYQAEDQFISGGVSINGTYLQNFAAVGARVIFTVNSSTSGNLNAILHYANGSGSNKTLNVYVNGSLAVTSTLANTGGATTWADKTEVLSLRRGLNTISYQYDSGNSGGVNIDSLQVQSGIALTDRGATLPYQEYEAENGTTTGQVFNASTTNLTVEAESSGRRAVKLSATGQYVQWTASQAANSLVIRYSMPDSSSGGGTTGTLSLYVNGVKTTTLDLSSAYAWTYGSYPYNDNPANLQGHHFYDESRFLVSNIPAGATVKLQKDAGDTAAYYTIDLIDLEQVDAAYAMPANFVSITSFGAVANDANDDTQAIRDAIANAKANGKSVWIPAGTFKMIDRVDVNNVQINGAGMWYTTLQGTNGKGGFFASGNNIKVIDLSITGDSKFRNDSADHAGFEGNFGTGSMIQNVWIEHTKVGFWLSSGTNGLYIVNGRIRDTWADGVNAAGGVQNTTVSHFNVRNTGDDAMAMWSNGAANVNDSFRYISAQLPMLANTFAIYGGQDNKILDSIGSDTVTASAGINISTRFGATAFGGTTEIRRNTLNRTGGYEPNWATSFGGLWIYAENSNITAPIVVDTLIINNSTYDGIKLSYNQTISNLTINNVQVNGAGSYGLNFDGVSGTGNFSYLTVTGAALGGLNNPNNLYTIIRGAGNSGW